MSTKNRVNDRRGFIRVPFNTKIRIETGTVTIESDSEINISMSGLRLPYAGTLPEPGDACRVTIFLDTFEDRIRIEAKGAIVRVEPGNLAIAFTEIDLDSYSHLRQLILNNTDEPEKAENEFVSHWGIKRPAL